jgi:asparagine synthase (glutamine-hydrolysing)
MNQAGVLLAWRPDGSPPEETFEAVAREFPARVRAMTATDRASTALRARIWGEAPAGAGERWVAVLGNPTRSGEGPPSPESLLSGSFDALSPPFAIVRADEGIVDVAIDRCGLQHLYTRQTEDGTVWLASSMLPLAAALGHATLDLDATAVWLAVGHHLGERTVIREVRKLGTGERLRLDADGARTLSRWGPDSIRPARDADYRETMLAAIRAAHASGDPAFELTGGLDSRLVLSGALTAGLPVRAWTIGDPGSAELRTVRRLQRSAGFEHIGVQVDEDPERFPELVHEMHALADGEVNALEYAPLLLAFAALEGRRGTSVSGSGGEIARGYYYAALHDGELDPSALAKKLSSATGPLVGALRRDLVGDPHAPLEAEVARLLENSPATTADGKLDDVYIRARMQRFGGRNITTTGYFCRQGLPFFDNDVVAASLGLPPERKQDGRVVRAAVASWAPELARIPLDTGIAVAPRDWRRPTTQARWAAAMGRKVLVRYGGVRGRRLARAGAPTVPWDDVRAAAAFRRLVGDALPASGARVHEVLDPAAVGRIVQAGMDGGALYPMGLLLTLELTLQRLGGDWSVG